MPHAPAIYVQRQDHSMEEAGQRLRRARERLNLKFRDVEQASQLIAEKFMCPAEAAKLVMPMTVSPSKKYLYAAIRSQPTRVLTYAIDPAAVVLSADIADARRLAALDVVVKTGRAGASAGLGTLA